MTTDLLLFFFAMSYWLFSVSFVLASLPDTKPCSPATLIFDVLMAVIAAPLCAPLILGVRIGDAIKDKRF